MFGTCGDGPLLETGRAPGNLSVRAGMRRLRHAFGALRDFFNGAGLPVCLLATAAVYEVFLLAVIFAPVGWGPWSRFSEEFKIWCFSYNPATGGMKWGAVWLMIFEPAVLALITVFFYRRNLWELGPLGAVRQHWRAALSGGVLTAVALLGLTAFSRPASGESAILPFPGKRIRTELAPPDIRLTDQRGREVSLESLRGKVVLIAGVYATCSTACPQILQTVKRMLDALPEKEREHFVALAISLDPENDASWMMNAIAETYGFPAERFHYLNGEVGNVRAILEHMGFSAIRNEQTGVIDHANLFVLVDPLGRIAYRFGLDPRHEPWMHEAIAELLAESGPAPVLTQGTPP